VDTEVDQRACQDVICGNTANATGKKVSFQELVREQERKVQSDQVGFCFEISVLIFVFLLLS
jgi:hypothetical protein